jgi:hypothetical protein
MTPDAQQPEHCEHEVVCRHHFPSDYAAGIPCKDTCKYDTRARPHTPAPERIITVTPNEYIADLKLTIGMLEAEVDRLTGIEAEAARTATLKTLDKLETDFKVTPTTGKETEYELGFRQGMTHAICVIESLRQRAGERE